VGTAFYCNALQGIQEILGLARNGIAVINLHFLILEPKFCNNPLTELLPFTTPLLHPFRAGPDSICSCLNISHPLVLSLVLKDRPTNAILRKRALYQALSKEMILKERERKTEGSSKTHQSTQTKILPALQSLPEIMRHAGRSMAQQSRVIVAKRGCNSP
jgi:hypothetical protein